MKNLIKAKISAITHSLFEAMPPSDESLALYQALPSEFAQEKIKMVLDVHSTFGLCSLTTFVVTRDRKKAAAVAWAGIMISMVHVYDLYNVKYHANKK